MREGDGEGGEFMTGVPGDDWFREVCGDRWEEMRSVWVLQEGRCIFTWRRLGVGNARVTRGGKFWMDSNVKEDWRLREQQHRRNVG